MKNAKNEYQASYGLILNSQNQFLLVRRSINDTFPGMWEFPGGTMEGGESLLETTKREVEEETGVKVTVLSKLAEKRGKSGSGKNVIRHAYLCQMINPEQEIQLSEEHDSYQWLTYGSILPDYISALVVSVYGNNKTLPVV